MACNQSGWSNQTAASFDKKGCWDTALRCRMSGMSNTYLDDMLFECAKPVICCMVLLHGIPAYLHPTHTPMP
eukprot:6187040-Pleurochrysis_carterae.AAC.1